MGLSIVVVGAGKIGESLCSALIDEGHDVTLIDQNPDRVFTVSENLDLKATVGNGAVPEVQREAGVEGCDVFISATPSDEINIIACIVASSFGAKHCAARIRNPEYSKDLGSRWRSIGIELVVNSNQQAAKEILEEFDYPSASYVEPFSVEGVELIKLRILAHSPMDGIHISDIHSYVPGILVCVVQSKTAEARIPSAAIQLHAGDYVHIIGHKEDLDTFLKLAGHKPKKLQTAFIIGGGITARYLLPGLLKRNIQVKLIEQDKAKAQALALEFPGAEIVVGDGTDQSFLDEQRLKNYDVSVALTSIDEENLFFSLYAHKLGVKKTITKVSRVGLGALLDEELLDSIITPRLSVANHMIRFVRSLSVTKDSESEGYLRLDNGVAEVSTFLVKEGCKLRDIKLRDLKLKGNTLLGLILRNGEKIIPKGDDCIRSGDRVIVVSMHHSLRRLDNLLRNGS